MAFANEHIRHPVSYLLFTVKQHLYPGLDNNHMLIIDLIFCLPFI